MSDSHEDSTLIVPPTTGGLEEIQKVLLWAERERLDRLEADRGRLDHLESDLNQLGDDLKNKGVDATAVANVLPDAISQRGKILEPVFGKILAAGIRRNRTFFADALFPVIGPAIRKAIATALQDMVQSMNQSLDHSLSRRGLTWRWEAWRTGKSFGEVVLSHTVKYQVDRVVLFFKEDGLHLADVHRSGLPPFEDLASSMFSAIQTAVQKFTQDEFQASEGASCNTFEMDDGTKVWIEQGSKAVLVAVVRGLPPAALRDDFKAALESIHFELHEALQNFRGDKTAFEATRPYLESCLLHEESASTNEAGSTRGGLSPALMVVLMLLLITLVWGITGAVASYFERQRWADFQDKVRGKPGIHITSIDTSYGKNGKTLVYGLRDPLSDDPEQIAREAGLVHGAIDFQLEPYLSLAPELVERRARDHRRRLDELIQDIEKLHFDFQSGSASLAAESDLTLQELRHVLRKSDALALQLGNRIQVEILGNTSDEGSAEVNRRLALARAQGILSALNVERFPAINFLPIADSSESSATTEIQGSKFLRERRVSFYVTVNDFGSRP